jgi:gamma-glutamyl-gamma-aminobutyrate hydrolase PuuD
LKTIAISQRIDDYPDRNERRDALDQSLIRFVCEAGFLPSVVPNSLVDIPLEMERTVDVSIWTTGIGMQPNRIGRLEQFLERVRPDGIVLSGGNDVGLCLDRDLTEAVLLRYALRQGIPVLGICRGMQMMAVYMGSTLEKADGHVSTRHTLRGAWTHQVNSYHTQVLVSAPDGFAIRSTSEDGVIEAIENVAYRWQGWMWHPEREHPFNQTDIHHFKRLFK